jgi:GntR family transcriptional regulator
MKGARNMISLDYRDSKSIYEQIVMGFRELIVNGILKTDEQLPSVRELSISLTVNPNTVQKAYKQLETDGYIYSIKGKGNFVSTASVVKSNQKTEELYETLKKTISELMFLGESNEKIRDMVSEIYSKREER